MGFSTPNAFLCLLLVVVVYASLTCEANRNAGRGILSDGSTELCFSYNTKWARLPEGELHVVPMLEDDPYGCAKVPLPLVLSHARSQFVLLVERGNCSFAEKAQFAAHLGAAAVLVGSNDSALLTPGAGNTSVYIHGKVFVAIVVMKDFERIQSAAISNNTTMVTFSKLHVSFPASRLLIVVFAVVVIVAASVYHNRGMRLWRQQLLGKVEVNRLEETALKMSRSGSGDEDFEFKPYHAIFFVIFISMFLLLLYFFIEYLVYFIIAIFAVGSAYSMYYLIRPALPKWQLKVPLPVTSRKPLLRNVLLAMSCIGLSITFVYFRNEEWIWPLQNMLAVALIIHVLGSLRFKSLRAISVLLVVMFFYDAFFVYITPYFTKSHESVMASVATYKKEKIPMTLTVPGFTSNRQMEICDMRSGSLLGFGDVALPGVLCTYCLTFDYFMHPLGKLFYFPAVIVGYVAGLLFAELALVLMKTAQPALVYIVPCTLVLVVLIGWRRRQLALLWRGIKNAPPALPPIDEEIGRSPELPLSEIDSFGSATEETVSESETEKDPNSGERQRLI